MFDIDIAAKIQRLALFAVPFLLGIVCHEVAHGYAAYLQGDPTAKNAGRLTLNPVKHFEPAGVLFFVVTALLTPFVFGWAKPVPVNPRYFKNPRKGMLWVALAGPGTNILLGFAFALGLKLCLMALGPGASMETDPIVVTLLYICVAGVAVNMILALFNLLPIPPLDGSNVVLSLLPRDMAMQYMAAGRYGFFIILLLAVTGVLWHIINPILYFMMSVPFSLFNIPPDLFL